MKIVPRVHPDDSCACDKESPQVCQYPSSLVSIGALGGHIMPNEIRINRQGIQWLATENCGILQNRKTVE
jgi:hypothetical protein